MLFNCSTFFRLQALNFAAALFTCLQPSFTIGRPESQGGSLSCKMGGMFTLEVSASVNKRDHSISSSAWIWYQLLKVVPHLMLALYFCMLFLLYSTFTLSMHRHVIHIASYLAHEYIQASASWIFRVL